MYRYRLLFYSVLGIVFALSITAGASAQDKNGLSVGKAHLRDEGGYKAVEGKVKTGVFYCADDLSKLDRDGVDALVKMGIKTVVDMRQDPKTPASVEALSDGKIRVITLPMIADPIKDKNDFYKRMIVNSRESLTGIIDLLSDKKNLPLVIFDTDGIEEVQAAAAFVLLVLGVDGRDVVEDYLLPARTGVVLKREWGEIIVKYFEEYGGMNYYTSNILKIPAEKIQRVQKNLITQ